MKPIEHSEITNWLANNVATAFELLEDKTSPASFTQKFAYLNRCTGSGLCCMEAPDHRLLMICFIFTREHETSKFIFRMNHYDKQLATDFFTQNGTKVGVDPRVIDTALRDLTQHEN